LKKGLRECTQTNDIVAAVPIFINLKRVERLHPVTLGIDLLILISRFYPKSILPKFHQFNHEKAED
jgi:hypothetical protein